MDISEQEFTSVEGHVEEEAVHFRKVLNTFALYKSYALSSNNRRRTDYHSLPERHKALLPDYLEKLNRVDQAIIKNYEVVKKILTDDRLFVEREKSEYSANVESGTSAFDENNEMSSVSPSSQITDFDMDKLRSTIKQFVRDWAEEGKVERDAVYLPLINEINEFFKEVTQEQRSSVRILVPGAGLARLAFDIAKLGYSCQGNEFSFYMLLASHFILNRIEYIHQYEIYPYIHSFSNIKSSEDQLKPVFIPDILPNDLPSDTDFSMVAGDFVEVYGSDEYMDKWDCIVTCFFIDTAKNIVEYIEIFQRILKPGGLWINIGPLLYHYENMPDEISIELSLEQVKEVVKKFGFEFQKEKMIRTTYTTNPKGMLQYLYECAFWSCIKKTHGKTNGDNK
ncbi:2063_t:CDS:10 [Ambispora gerdemannii]|uniref:carnosine N-methyltransferase n=1 Tax=Ambispora gerdemannii TaxID=144530 RepID=A0A9N8WDP7_9GLOM|nr:2063_t:CDS:10 [Ambispora gerdemannii]